MVTKTICLVAIDPHDQASLTALLKWDGARSVPVPGETFRAKQITFAGLVCEVDDADLAKAQEFGKVRVIDKKEIQL